MPAKKIAVPVTPDMEKSLDELGEFHALQRPALCTMLLRDALAGRRSSLLPKKIVTPRNGSKDAQTHEGVKTSSGGFGGAERGSNGNS